MSRFIKIRLIILTVVASIVVFTGTRNCDAQPEGADLKYELAAGYYERAQWDEANRALGDFLTNHPDAQQAPQANFFLAEGLMQQRNFKAAYLHYQSFLKRFGEHSLADRAMFRMGESAYRGNNTSTAISMLEEFTRKYPEHDLNPYAFSYLGQLRLIKSEPQLAQFAFQHSLQNFPNGPLADECRLGLGISYLKQGYVKDAKRLFEYCVNQIQIQPSLKDKAKVQLGLLALQQTPTDHIEAEKWFSTVVENADNDTIRATAILYWARSVNESDPNKAFNLLEPAIGWELPTSIKRDLLTESAIAASRTDRTEIALGCLQQVRATEPLTKQVLDAVRFEIRLLKEQENIQEAIDLADKFNLEVEKQTLIATTQDEIGRKQYYDGEYSESLETFGTLLQLEKVDSKQQTTWRLFKALNLIGLKQFQEAETSLEKIADSFTEDKSKSLVKFLTGSVKFRLEKYEAAIPYFKEYLKQDIEPSDRNNTMQELAICFVKTDNLLDADPLLDTLVNRVGTSVREIDAEVESVIELVAEAAQQGQDEAISAKWYAYLNNHSQDRERKMRANRWLLSRSLETPVEQQTLSSFARLFVEHPKDVRLVAAAIENAQRIEKEGNIPAAIQWYQLALTNSPVTGDHPISGVQIKIAKLASKQGDAKNLMTAKVALQAWLASASGDTTLIPEVLFQLAWVHHDLGESAQALSNFDQLTRNHPNSKYWPDAAYRVAKHKVVTNDYANAKPLLDKILATSNLPDEIRARSYFLAGKTAFAQQDWAKVESAMKSFKAKTTAGDNIKLTADYFIAEALFQQQKDAEATIAFDELHLNVASFPSEYQPWVWLRKASLKLGAGDAIEAAKLATEAKQRFSDFNSTYEFDYLLARGLEAEGRLTDARREFEKVVASATGSGTETAANAQWRIGETHFHQENYESAIAEYYKVDSLYTYPKWRAAALVQAGKCQEHLSNSKNAIILYQQLLDRYPGSEFASEARQRMTKINLTVAKTENYTEHVKY